MDFPRFTSGSLGRLSFEHVNEIVDVVEKVRDLLRRNPGLLDETPPEVFFARITAVGSQTTGDHQWTEVLPKSKAALASPTQWQDRDGGRKSYAPADGDRYQPAFVLHPFTFNGTNPTVLTVGTVVALSRTKGPDGKVAFQILYSAAAPANATEVFPARLAAAISRDNPNRGRWKYEWVEQELIATGGSLEWNNKPNGRKTVALGGTYPPAVNGCELLDTPGIGGVSNPAAIESNAFVGAGVVVQMHLIQNGAVPYFSIPNGLNITCP